MSQVSLPNIPEVVLGAMNERLAVFRVARQQQKEQAQAARKAAWQILRRSVLEHLAVEMGREVACQLVAPRMPLNPPEGWTGDETRYWFQVQGNQPLRDLDPAVGTQFTWNDGAWVRVQLRSDRCRLPGHEIGTPYWYARNARGVSRACTDLVGALLWASEDLEDLEVAEAPPY